MELLEVGSMEGVLQLPRSKWGIPEPPVDSPAVEPSDLDLLLVPAVALDLARRRCGHGAGFYDRYIERARAGRRAGGGRCRTIGVGLAEQLEEAVPEESHDERLDGVVFPDVEAMADDERPEKEVE